MKILEFQSKKICEEYEIPVPESKLILNANSIQNKLSNLNFPIVLKSQVLSNRRAKAGGICLARNIREAHDFVVKMFRLKIHELATHSILAEELVEYDYGFMIKLAFDPDVCKIVMSGSPSLKSLDENGKQADIEHDVYQFEINPFIGVPNYSVMDLAAFLEIDDAYWDEFLLIVQAMWKIFDNYDATRIELNPLVISKDNDFQSLGVEMEFDEFASFRQPLLTELVGMGSVDGIEYDIKKIGCGHQECDGDLCIIANDMEVCKAVSQIFENKQIHVAEWVNLKNPVTSQKVNSVFNLISENLKSKIVFLTVYSGGKDCIEAANGIKHFLVNSESQIPVMVRLRGENIQQAEVILESTGVDVVDSFNEAMKIYSTYRKKEGK